MLYDPARSPLYEQEVRDHVGAAAAVELTLPPPEVLKLETCLMGSPAPHFGQTGGFWVLERTR